MTQSPDSPNQSVANSPLELNPQLVAAMLAAIREQPKSVGLSDDQLLGICEQAVLENRLHDQNWLEGRLDAAHYQTGAHEEHFHAAQNIHPGDRPPPATDQALSPDSMPHAPHDGLRDHNKLGHIPVAEHQEPQSQQQLDEIIEKHGHWIASVLHPNKELEAGRADLRGADLRAFQLTGVDLRGASLQGVMLDGLDLSGCNLSTARLQGASLRGCILKDAKLRRADLSGADLQGAQLEDCDLSRAILEDCKLEETILAPEPTSESATAVEQEEPTQESLASEQSYEPDGDASFEFDDGSDLLAAGPDSPKMSPDHGSI